MRDSHLSRHKDGGAALMMRKWIVELQLPVARSALPAQSDGPPAERHYFAAAAFELAVTRARALTAAASAGTLELS